MRKSIRDLMKFAKSEGEAIHYTEFEDTWTERTEGVEFDNSEDFEDYEKKVNSYLTTHADTLPIYKLSAIINLLQQVTMRCYQRYLLKSLNTRRL
ncbi:MAG: hypothetical protein ACLSEV_05655 [Coprococcus sp.]